MQPIRAHHDMAIHVAAATDISLAVFKGSSCVQEDMM